MTRLFDEGAAIDGRWAGNVSSYEYLARSTRPEAAAARTLLETWFEAYPAEKKSALASRFRARRDVSHDAAFLELCLYRLLSSDTSQSIRLEPELSGVSTSPDFEITTSDNLRIILEATTATGMTDRQRGAQRNAEILLETIRTVESPDFYLDISITGTVTSLDGQRTVVSELRRFLEGLDYDEVANGFPHWTAGPRGPEQTFSANVERPGFRFVATAIPRGETRGPSSPALAVWHVGDLVGYRETQSWIRDAITEKAGRYGDLRCPYVIAVNVFDFTLSTRDIIHAVLGSQQVTLTLDNSTREVVDTRHTFGSDGAFGTPNLPRRTNVSAVLCCNQLTPWSIADRRLILVHNPWAEHRLPANWLGCAEVTFDDSGAASEVGDASLGRLLGVSTLQSS